MQLTITHKTKTELVMELAGEDHTLLNLLKSSLLDDPDVRMASYQIEHPETSEPVMFVHTTTKDPVQVVREALERIDAEIDEFKEKFSEKLKAQ